MNFVHGFIDETQLMPQSSEVLQKSKFRFTTEIDFQQQCLSGNMFRFCFVLKRNFILNDEINMH